MFLYAAGELYRLKVHSAHPRLPRAWPGGAAAGAGAGGAQVYVDDIVFGCSSNSLIARFADDMSREFEMSMMGELQFFLGLQIKQSKEGTFVH
jgi:hypothetical protein